MSAPAGWYPDPSDPSRTRWWDGTQWTHHEPPAAQAAADAPAAPAPHAAPAYPSYAQAPSAPAYSAPAYPAYPSAPPVAARPSAPGVDTNTIWIYLAILASTLPVFSIFLLDYNNFVATMISLDESGRGGDAEAAAVALQWVGGILLITLLSYVLLGVSVLFSWLDYRELKRRGVERPFHWGFAFFALVISIGVYIIGRTVVLKRETGSGLTALWVWIGSIVLSIIITIAWTVAMWQQTIQIVPTS